MKKILFSFAFMCLGLVAFAQAPLKEGDIAPDFTYTDINSVAQHLYSYTDSGYTVIMDISATWCGPCWAVHNSHVFETLTDHYGFSGTVDPKKIKVIFFEGDATTNTADLHGTGTNTQGDWVTGTNYSIIDDAGIKTPYPIDGYPHFYIICPNRTVSFSQAGYNTAMLSENFWTPYMTACPVKVTGTNAGTIAVTTSKAVCAGSATPLTAKIQNLGTTALTSATVNAKVGAATVATTTWSGSLNTYDMATVNVGNYTFPAGNTAVTYEVIASGDVKASDNSKVLSSSAITSNYKTWTLLVKTDQYPGEFSWKIKNSAGTIVQQASYTAGTGTGGAGGPDAGKTFVYPMTLNANECYTIEAHDAFGDGLWGVAAAADTGFVKLFDDMIVTPMFTFGGEYADASTIAKTGTVTAVNNIEVSNINVYPNPASSELYVSGVEGKATFTFVDLMGRTVKVINNDAVNGTNKLNVSDLAKGSYVLKISQNGKTSTKSVVIAE